MLTLEQFEKYTPRKSYPPKQSDLLAALSGAMTEADITTSLRIAHFLGQISTETGNFKWFTEIGSEDYFKKYDGRHDLGNTHPGDGPRYKGRGMLQLTGRANYTSVGTALGLDLVDHPEIAAELVAGARIAGHYWTTHHINALADKDDVLGVTKKINGGTNGLKERKEWTAKAKRVLGI